MMTKPGLLCKHKVSVYRSSMENSDHQSFRERLREAIEQSPPSQTAIAKFCDVTVQSVGGWKRSGQITKENLRKVSEISGYRYLWILEGEGHKLYTSQSENRKEMGIGEQGIEYSLYRQSPAAEKLIKSVRYALANDKLSDGSIERLADFINALVELEQ